MHMRGMTNAEGKTLRSGSLQRISVISRVARMLPAVPFGHSDHKNEGHELRLRKRLSGRLLGSKAASETAWTTTREGFLTTQRTELLDLPTLTDHQCLAQGDFAFA